MASRGTESLLDLDEDIHYIGLNGVAKNQAVDMLNWVQQLSAHADEKIIHFSYDPTDDGQTY